MKKTALLTCLLIALVTLGGCNGSGSDISDSSAEPDSRETEQTSENTAYVHKSTEATESAESTESAETAVVPQNEYISDHPDWFVPKLSDQKVTFDLSGGVSWNKIKDEIGYDIDFDVTSLDYYDSCVQYVEEEFSGEKLEAIRERNYIVEVSPFFVPLCTEEADWLAVENYNMYGVKGTFLSRMLLIKDGEITRTFDLRPEQIYGNSVNNAVYSRGELYINCGSGLKRIDTQTGETQMVIAYDGLINYGLITAVSDDYIICGNGSQAVLALDTKEVFYPDILWHPSGDEPLRLIGDRIEYTEDGVPKVYDIKSRTLTEDSSLVFAKGYAQRDNDKWSVCFEIADGDISEPECLTAVRAINIADGSERVYDLKVLNSELTGDIIYNWGTLMLDGDMLWIDIGDYFTGVLNLATGESAEAERRYSEMSYISDGIMKITDEVDGGYPDGDYLYYIANVNYPV